MYVSIVVPVDFITNIFIIHENGAINFDIFCVELFTVFFSLVFMFADNVELWNV
jgi:hypothetical protein